MIFKHLLIFNQQVWIFSTAFTANIKKKKNSPINWKLYVEFPWIIYLNYFRTRSSYKFRNEFFIVPAAAIFYTLYIVLSNSFLKSLPPSLFLSLENVITFSPIKVFTLNFNNSFHQLLSNSIVLKTVPGESIWTLNTENFYARISLSLSRTCCAKHFEISLELKRLYQ